MLKKKYHGSACIRGIIIFEILAETRGEIYLRESTYQSIIKYYTYVRFY